MAISHGFEIEWHPRWGETMKVSVDECPSPEAAKRECVLMARNRGWTPRLWWEVWRWGERHVELPE